MAVNTYPMIKRTLPGLALALTTAFFAATAPQASAYSWSTPRAMHPTRAEAKRLEDIQPYIEYFTSIGYGPTATMVDPAYLRALILTESSARPRARSPKGARGLTQILPAVGRSLAARLAASSTDYDYIDEAQLGEFRSEYLYDPAINILLACYLTARYTARYGGRSDLVASAWNAGPEAVDRYGKRPPPYAETRGLLLRLHGYMTFLRGGHAPMWSVHRWDTYGAMTSGWDLDYNAPGWNIGWSQPK